MNDTGQYDCCGCCEMCGAHKRDHGVGEKCPERSGPADMRGYDVAPRR